jgi:hypothetical protein
VLGQLSDATLLSNGRLAFADPGIGAILIVDSSGQFLATAGRRGNGPGEFQSVPWIRSCGRDSLFAWDPVLNRVSVFGHDGSYVRDFSFAQRPAVVTCSWDGVFGMVAMPAGMRAPSRERSDVYKSAFTLFSEEGDSVADVGPIVLGELRPLGKVTRVAVGRSYVVVGPADSLSLRLVSRRDASARSIALRLPERPATMAHYEAAITRMGAALDRAWREQFREMMLKLPPPPHLPPYTRLNVDPNDSIWLTTSVPDDSVTQVIAIDSSGAELARLSLPAGSDVLEVGQSHLLTRSSDADGHEVITLYRLTRPE